MFLSEKGLFSGFLLVILVKKPLKARQGTSSQYHYCYFDLVIWHSLFVSSTNSIQIVRRQCCLLRALCLSSKMVYQYLPYSLSLWTLSIISTFKFYPRPNSFSMGISEGVKRAMSQADYNGPTQQCRHMKFVHRFMYPPLLLFITLALSNKMFSLGLVYQPKIDWIIAE